MGMKLVRALIKTVSVSMMKTLRSLLCAEVIVCALYTVCLYMCVCVCVYKLCVCMCVYVCVCVCVCVCLSVCLSVCLALKGRLVPTPGVEQIEVHLRLHFHAARDETVYQWPATCTCTCMHVCVTSACGDKAHLGC